jgi:hypothetical protein
MVQRRYLLLLALGTIVAVGLAGLANWFVDPYALYGTARIEGVNARKPYAEDRGRTSKIYESARVKPHAVVVGNSRPEMGLDPLNACWPEEARPVYNIALPGAGVYTQTAYAQHAMAAGKVTTVVMTLDILDYLEGPGVKAPAAWPPEDATAENLLVDATGERRAAYPLEKVKNYATAAFSLETLADSVGTVAAQRSGSGENLTPLGFNEPEGLYLPILTNEGEATLFAQKNKEVADLLRSRRWGLYAAGTKDSPDLAALRHFLDDTGQEGVRTILVINPLHAEYLAILDLAGLWPLFEDWKKTLVEMTAGRDNVTLWDFTDFDIYSSEDIDLLPPRGKGLQWFWEPAHYKKELGDIILANIFRQGCGTSAPPYGEILTPQTLDAHDAGLRQRRDAYVRSHPKVLARLRALLQD